MDFDIREIREYYDSELRAYDFNELVSLGISHDNADFMVGIGVPEEFDDFVFYGTNDFKQLLIEGMQFIRIGHYTSNGYGLYVKGDGNELFTSSSFHEPKIYMLNKNLKTFFLFHLIRQEVSMRMKQQSEYTSYKYASELRKVYEKIDPEAMKDVEGYWSHRVEDYETGL
ncbi:SUKH-4 family immunity protein [Paenibacillus thiaminolyticus]|uniref:SUKH-4 family immunity protein n=1 Tax=Paenibacillus thiaminolyticus TaxID=49283 RepID=UPI002543B8E6|nr:SUKH-4 family immunity protein [Paenibacillus thiaminolyticus]WII35816.1 SUKH-4 family immunity protein [Paenibacillus thiaminolyticus]